MSQALTGAILDSAVNYQQPTTAFTITLGNNDFHVILDPAGALASGTITMPPDPWDGQIINIRTSQTISALTFIPNSGQLVVAAPNALSVGGETEAIYKASDTTWYFAPGTISAPSLVAGSNLNFYVATTGSDSNPGTISQPFATIQHAAVVAVQYDYQGLYFPTINVGPGTYAIAAIIVLPVLFNVISPAVIKGDHVTASNVVIHDTVAAGVFRAVGPTATWNIDGFQLDTPYFAFQTASGGLFRIKGPLNLANTLGTNGMGLLVTSEGLGLFAGGVTITFLTASVYAIANLFFSSICQIAFGTVVFQPATAWTTAQTISDFSAFNFVGNSVVNAGSGTGGGVTLTAFSVYQSTTGTSQDIAQTGGVSGDPTCAVVIGTGVSGAGFFHLSKAGPPAAAQIPSGTYLPFKDTNAAAGAGLDMFFNDAGTVLGVRGGAPYKTSVPVTGGTVTSSYGLRSNILLPVGTLATLTVNLPTGQYEGAITRISSSQAITALTVATTDGSSVVGAPATLPLGGAAQFMYNTSGNTWYVN